MHAPCIIIYYLSKAPPLLIRQSVSVIILLLVCSLMVINYTVCAQTIQPLPHSNHYILLIDASGSDVTPEAKRRVYEKALLEHLLPRLYQQGFSEVIPQYDPEHDWLTLQHFGIVTGDSNTAYSRLTNYDFLTDFIHPVFVRKKAVTPDNLRQDLISLQVYQYTILSWAKELALNQSRADSKDNISNRTFMILVHDGVPNENSLAQEVEMVRRWARPSYEKVFPLINSIDSKYRFTDGKGNNSPVWSEEVNDVTNQTSAPIFIEAYEVVSVAQANWEKIGKQITPLDNLEFRWTRESGDAPEGALSASLNGSFNEWIHSAENPEVSFRLEQAHQLPSSNSLEVPVIFEGALSCTPRTFNVAFNVSMQQTDELLGTRQINYIYPRIVTAPPPWRCTLGFILFWGLVALVALIVITVGIYSLYYRFFNTHIEIELPGTIVPIHLKRRGQIAVDVPVVPQKEIEALSIKLPSLLKQRLFYRGATITLESKDGEPVRWSNNSDHSEIRLPLERQYVLAYWSKLPDKPSSIAVNYQQGNQRMDVLLSYPSALSGQPKGVKV